MENKNNYKHILYKDSISETKVLITESCNGKYPVYQTLANDNEIYIASIWIHDNIIMKLRIDSNKYHEGNIISSQDMNLIIKGIYD